MPSFAAHAQTHKHGGRLAVFEASAGAVRRTLQFLALSFLAAIVLAAGATQATAQTGFAGLWRTTFGPMTLTAQDDRVEGFYVMNGARCTLAGELRAGRFMFRYEEPTARGNGWFVLANDGRTFSGQWCRQGTADWLDWTGWRITPEQEQKLQERDRRLHEAVRLIRDQQFDQARTTLAQAIELEHAVWGKGHPDLERSLPLLANLHLRHNDFAAARQARRSLVDARAALYGADDWRTVDARFEALDLDRLAALPEEDRRRRARAIELQTAAANAQAAKNLADAVAIEQQALELLHAVYTKQRYPSGHPEVISSLKNLAGYLKLQGKLPEAKDAFSRAVEAARQFYEQVDYPRGHPLIAQLLTEIVYCHTIFAEMHAAQLEVLEAYQRLYPPDKYPQGHADLAQAHESLAWLCGMVEEHRARAREHFEAALRIRQQLYPPSRCPDGHPEIANSLTELAWELQRQGDPEGALALHQQAMEMNRRFYNQRDFPEGHLAIIISLRQVGGLYRFRGEYVEARRAYEEAYAMAQRLFPPQLFPTGHSEINLSLRDLALVAWDQHRLGDARRMLEEVLERNQRLYPAEQFPNGHSEVAWSLYQLGDLLCWLDEYAQARVCLQQAADMYRRIDTTSSSGLARPYIATCLHKLATVQVAQGDYDRARQCLEEALHVRKTWFPGNYQPVAETLGFLSIVSYSLKDHTAARRYAEEALAMWRQVYPPDKFPDGHGDLVSAHITLAALCWEMGDNEAARAYSEQGLAMAKRVYSPEKFPEGHRTLGSTIGVHGVLLWRLGQYEEAQAACEENLQMQRKLHPADEYPQGHTNVAASLLLLGRVLQSQDKRAEARQAFAEMCNIFLNQAESFVAAASEAEALNYMAFRGRFLDNLLSAAATQKARPDDDLYAFVWRKQGLVQRTVAARQRTVMALQSPAALDLYSRYLEARRHLAQLTLTTASGDAGQAELRAARLREWTDRKEAMERQLAAQASDFRRQLETLRRTHRDLVDRLPENACVVDFVRFMFTWQEADRPGHQGWHQTAAYMAFVLRRGQPAMKVTLDTAEKIDAAILRWRQDIELGQVGTAATDVRRLVWEKIEPLLPPAQGNAASAAPKGSPSHAAAVPTVYICPDGRLASVPWAALPGSQPGTVLLEEYSLAVLPHAQFLLNVLEDQNGVPPSDAPFLAVGDVAYDEKPIQAPLLLAANRGAGGVSGLAPATTEKPRWEPLGATTIEIESAAALAAERNLRVVLLRGNQASVGKVVAELPQARWTHFATHGFLADARFRSYFQLQEENFEKGEFSPTAERSRPAGRNPLTLSGIVLAGANLLPPKDENGLPQGEGGILTAEIISGMHCPRLELVVLSACESGLGDVAGGEGVYGLQRAFHTAGARNVVASLWKVDDAATLALMRLFYRQLWQRELPPLEALRQAQLYLYRRPDEIARIAQMQPDELAKEKLRGIDVSDDRPAAGEPVHGKPVPGQREAARVRLWAGFVLSGAGK